MTSADTVYASPTSLYVATNGGWERDDTSIHRFDLDRRRPHRLPRQRAGARRPARPVLDVGVQGRAAGGDHRLVGRQEPEPRDRAAAPLGAAGEDRPGRRARRGRAHLRGALHRRPRLRRHVPPDRPAVHARPRRSRRVRACAASSRSPATRPTCTRSARTGCSASGRTRRLRAPATARSCRCSTSPTRPRRSCSARSSSARSPPPRSSTTTTPSCGGTRCGWR